MAKHNLPPTQLRMDDFRETIREIVNTKSNEINGEYERFKKKRTIESSEIEQIIKQKEQKLRLTQNSLKSNSQSPIRAQNTRVYTEINNSIDGISRYVTEFKGEND